MTSTRSGLSSPVAVAENVDSTRNYEHTRVADLVTLTDEELVHIDPLAMNLIVAKRISRLANLDIRHYQNLVNEWTNDFRDRCLPKWEPHFDLNAREFFNDIHFFRLGMLCQYLELEIGIEYNQDQRDGQAILYTNPSDLFLNGVLDTRQGTCGNMAALHVAMGWRMGWPVSLACVNSHFICRYDDGQRMYNIEATQSGYGGFKSDPDEYLIETRRLPAIAVESGSDLRALRPREMLGAFVGLRARHVQDVGKFHGCEQEILASETDWLLARQLFPTNRVLFKNQMVITTMRGDSLFAPHEPGHPGTYAACLDELRIRRVNGWGTAPELSHNRSDDPRPDAIDQLFFKMEINS